MEHQPDHHRTATSVHDPGHPGDLPARRGHLFFPSRRPRRGSRTACLPLRVRVRDAGTGASRTPGGPLARTHRQQAGGPGGAALEQEKKV